MAKGRPKSDTVEFFPHYATSGKTLFILESKFGNDGYAFWFKLLELLCQQEGHYYDFSIDSSWEFLIARARVGTERAVDILHLLAEAGAIDKELYTVGIIWVQHLVDNLAPVYEKRGRKPPERPNVKYPNRNNKSISVPENAISGPGNTAQPVFPSQKIELSRISVPENTQSRVEESRVEESRVIPPIVPLEGDGAAAVFTKYFGEEKITDGLKIELKRLGSAYPPDWIEEAFREAVCQHPDKRHLKYVKGILRRMAREASEREKQDKQSFMLSRLSLKEVRALNEQGPDAVGQWLQEQGYSRDGPRDGLDEDTGPP